jgi:hypothetical protein
MNALNTAMAGALIAVAGFVGGFAAAVNANSSVIERNCSNGATLVANDKVFTCQFLKDATK